LKKTEERLSHHLAAEGMAQTINEGVAVHAASRIKEDTLLVIDPTDIYKPYAEHMPYLAKVRDGSTGELVQGYWACLALACEPNRRRVIPLHQRLWSAEAPDFVSENTQLLEVVDTIRRATGGRGIYVMDRGGDRMALYEPMLERGLRFIIRMRDDRNMLFHGHTQSVAEIAKNCPMKYIETIVKEEEGKEKHLKLEFGFRAVKLPGLDEQLYLVVVHGLGEQPLLLLTNVALNASRKRLWFIVQGYLTRWMVEEAIRFIKQCYHLEDLRVLDYNRLRNLVALVLAAAYFAATWLGESLKLAVLTTHITRISKRFFGVPEFHYYALADGIAALWSRLGRWTRTTSTAPPSSDVDQLPLAGLA
jgi:hypothetical protein